MGRLPEILWASKIYAEIEVFVGTWYGALFRTFSAEKILSGVW